MYICVIKDVAKTQENDVPVWFLLQELSNIYKKSHKKAIIMVLAHNRLADRIVYKAKKYSRNVYQPHYHRLVGSFGLYP